MILTFVRISTCGFLNGIVHKYFFTVNQQMGPAIGAAMIAMVGNGTFNRIEDIRDKQDLTKDMIYPNQSLKDYYDKKYSDYNQLYKRLVDFF